MSVIKSSGEGDLNITVDEHEEEVPGNEKKDEEKSDDVDAVHHGIVWPPRWSIKHSHPTPFFDDLPNIRRNSYINFKPGSYVLRQADPLTPEITALLEHPTGHSRPVHSFIDGYGWVISVILVVIFAAIKECCKTTRPGSVQATVVVGEGAAQQHIETDMPPPGQAEAVPPYIEMPPPYSDCKNMTVSEESPKDSEPLPNNNDLVEIGFKNECVDMTTTPNATGDVNTEFASDNDRIVERLNLELKESAEGTRRADDRDNVMYVDEKLMPNQRAKYTK